MKTQNISNKSDAPLDFDELSTRCLGRVELVERVLGRFQESLGSELAELESAVRGADNESVARVAHRLKGTSVTVSAHDLQACAARLEELANSGDDNGLDKVLSEVQEECARLTAYIADRA